MKISSYNMNIIYTEGILTGLTVKFCCLYIFANKKMIRLRIPLYPMSYNRKTGLELREQEKLIRTLHD